MVSDISRLFQQKNILSHTNEGITICPVENAQAGIDLAREILHKIVDRKTALYLSGGSTPRELYKMLARDEKPTPGAVGMVDERYGEKWHAKSNELMMRETELLRYFELTGVPFYPILSRHREPEGRGDLVGIASSSPETSSRNDGYSRGVTAQAYDEKLRSLNAIFQKNVAVLGIGADGHTAGIPARKSKVESQKSKVYDTYDLVTEYNDESGMYGERVTMTFLGLTMMDILLVLVFGEDKAKALDWVFQKGSEEEIPARFYKRPDIASKTIIITDQQI